MARTDSPSPGVQRLTSLTATVLVAAAAAIAFGRVFEGAWSTLQLLTVGILSAVLAWILERRGLLLATAASATALLVVIGIVAFRETTWYGLPTLETLRQMGEAASAVSEQARIQTAPTPPIDPLVLAGVVAMWAAVFSCHALAFRAGSPLLALVPPVALLAFADTVLEELIRPLYGVLFLVGALAVVYADNVRRTQSWGPIWSARVGRRIGVIGASGRGARRLAAAALAAAAVAPLAVPGFGSAGLVDLSSVNGGDRLLVDPLVSVAAELTREDGVDVLSVVTTTPSYLRMFTLGNFDGITWRLETPDDSSELISQTIAQVDGSGETFRQELTVLTDLGFPWLPLAAEPTFVGLTGPLEWSEGSATLSLGEPLDEGQTYATTSALVQPAPEVLGDVEAHVPGGDDLPYLDLPGDLPPEIEATANAWVAEAGAETDYEMVLAIQEELQTFVYDPTVELRDDSTTLARFLTETRAGFCQQFASSMAVMLRTLGIPARVAVGFTQGSQDLERADTYTISTDNLHSWVEVPFGEHGWLAFEPTPGRDNPVAATYQEPDETQSCFRRGCADDPRANQGQQDPQTSVGPTPRNPFPEREAPSSLAPGEARAADLRRRIIPAAAGLAVAVIASIPLWRWIRRRRRLRRARGDPRRFVLAVYDVMAQRAAELGAGRGPGETPLEYLRRLDASERLADGHLERLTAIATHAAYAPWPVAADDALDAEADAREVVRGLRRTTSPLRRLTGAYRRA